MADNEAITLTGASEDLNDGFTKLNVWRTNQIKGDGTANRCLRCSSLKVEDGTQASKIKCTMSSVWNGDSASAEDNLAKSADTGNFNLDATGAQIHIESGAFTGNVVAVLIASIYSNATGNVIAVTPTVVSSGITLAFQVNDGNAYDLTTAADNGDIYIRFLYLTSE